MARSHSSGGVGLRRASRTSAGLERGWTKSAPWVGRAGRFDVPVSPGLQDVSLPTYPE